VAVGCPMEWNRRPYRIILSFSPVGGVPFSHVAPELNDTARGVVVRSRLVFEDTRHIHRERAS